MWHRGPRTAAPAATVSVRRAPRRPCVYKLRDDPQSRGVHLSRRSLSAAHMPAPYPPGRRQAMLLTVCVRVCVCVAMGVQRVIRRGCVGGGELRSGCVPTFLSRGQEMNASRARPTAGPLHTHRMRTHEPTAAPCPRPAVSAPARCGGHVRRPKSPTARLTLAGVGAHRSDVRREDPYGQRVPAAGEARRYAHPSPIIARGVTRTHGAQPAGEET